MRHRKGNRKLGRLVSHRLSMLANQTVSLLEHSRITTTLTKAQETRKYAERLITIAKDDTLHARRMVLSKLRQPDMVRKLFADIAPRYRQRPGGYTRIFKTGFRHGDNAPMAVLELV